MKIEQLRTNHLTNPVGFRLEKPVFSYVITEAEGKKQASARIVVASDRSFGNILFDSGERSDLSSLSFSPDLALSPRTRYYWKVFASSDAGEKGESETAFFETGKMNEPWEGKWIKAPMEDVNVHPLFRKVFSLKKMPASARLYLCGLGLYEAEINGKHVGDECLAPGLTAYDTYVQAQTYDVGDLLHPGENAIGVALGNGWYCGRYSFTDQLDHIYGPNMTLIAELRVRYEDGTEETLAPSDESWLCSPSPVLFSNIYDGEIYDAAKEIPGWSEVGCGGKDFANAVLSLPPIGTLGDRLSPPVKVMSEHKPKLIRGANGDFLLDFEQIITGRMEFDCFLPAGSTVSLDCGEILQDGNFYNENLRSAKEHFAYTSSGRPAHVRPHFTFYSYRYIRVQGMTEEEIRKANFVTKMLRSEMDEIGTISTSNEKVNRLILNALWSQRDNFLDIPTDCPQRDERMGWTGDAEVFSATASFNMYTPAFYRKFLNDMKNEQRKLGGSCPHVVPNVLDYRKIRTGQTLFDSDQHGSCAWADAATIIPWTVYQFFGDKELLKENYENMHSWVDWIKKQDEEKCGGKRLWTSGFHFADWLALDNPDKTTALGGTDCYYIATAYYYYSTQLTAKAAKVLGKAKDYEKYQKLAEEIKDAFQKEYYTPTGRLAQPTQTAHAIALYMGLVPDRFRERTVRDLKARLDAKKVHLDTGFVGTYQLCAALSGNGLNDYAHTLLLNEDYPSWLYEVNLGATTIWERWNSILPDGRISGTGMNSMNHYSYGSVVEWMYRNMAGLNPSEEGPGFKRATIAPKPDPRFTSVESDYFSASGRYRSEWRRTEGGFVFTVEVPFDAEAAFVLPSKFAAVTVNGAADLSLAETGRTLFTKGIYEIIAEE